MDRYMIHSATGAIISLDGEVLRRILTAAYASIRRLPDRTEVEQEAMDTVVVIQDTYRELV